LSGKIALTDAGCDELMAYASSGADGWTVGVAARGGIEKAGNIYDLRQRAGWVVRMHEGWIHQVLNYAPSVKVAVDHFTLSRADKTVAARQLVAEALLTTEGVGDAWPEDFIASQYAVLRAVLNARIGGAW
jgi:hypothetical protein